MIKLTELVLVSFELILFSETKHFYFKESQRKYQEYWSKMDNEGPLKFYYSNF